MGRGGGVGGKSGLCVGVCSHEPDRSLYEDGRMGKGRLQVLTLGPSVGVWCTGVVDQRQGGRAHAGRVQRAGRGEYASH